MLASNFQVLVLLVYLFQTLGFPHASSSWLSNEYTYVTNNCIANAMASKLFYFISVHENDLHVNLTGSSFLCTRSFVVGHSLFVKTKEFKLELDHRQLASGQASKC